MTLPQRALLRVCEGLASLLRVGAPVVPAPIVLWPRLTATPEVAEQYWRAAYFYDGHAVTMWVGGDASCQPPPRPEHVGPVRETPPPVRLVRGRMALLRALLYAVRHRGVLLCWQRWASGTDGLFRRKLARAWLRVETFDRHETPDEGTRLAIFASELHRQTPENPRRDLPPFLDYLAGLPRLNRCYIFGTGPSLALAQHMDFSDGYRVICNTIVKDKQLLERIQPHFVVAGDGVYHFGYTRYSYAFRADLLDLLQAQPIRFLYPQVYDGLVRRELQACSRQIVGIPMQAAPDMPPPLDLRRQFLLPAGGNVLTVLLLPLAATLANEVFLLGFDGRAPSDKLFWTYSPRHHYDDLFPGLNAAYPSFFVRRDIGKYFQQVFRDEVETIIQTGEAAGKSFIPLVPSFSPALGRRYRPEAIAARPAAERRILQDWAQRFHEQVTPA